MPPMHRRLLLTAALACCPASRVLAQADAPRPRHKVSAGELHKALSSRFPVRFDFGGLLDLQVSAARLLLLLGLLTVAGTSSVPAPATPCAAASRRSVTAGVVFGVSKRIRMALTRRE